VIGFDTITIEEATEAIIDYRGRTPPKTNSGIPLITAKVIKDGRILEERREFIAPNFYDDWMRRGLPRRLDVLITTEAPLGQVAILRGTAKIALAQRVILLRARRSRMDPVFLFYALQSEFSQGELHARATGTTVAGIKQSELRRVRLPIFALPVQRRIADILSAYDELMENFRRRILLLEEMARALYREWFIHFRFPGHEKVPRVNSSFGRVPKGWRVKAVPECVDINPRITTNGDCEKPFVPMGCLANNSMLISEIETRAGKSGAKFQNGDTLFARITPCLENGKTGFVQFLPNDDAVAFGSTEFIVMRSRTLTPEFVYLMARSEDFRGNAIKSMSGTSGRQRVQEKCFSGFSLAHPARDLLDRFSDIVAPSFRLIQQLHLEIENLRRARDLLLPRLLSGQVCLDVSAVEDVAERTAPAPPRAFPRSQVQPGNDEQEEEPALRAAEEAPLYRTATSSRTKRSVQSPRL
jgi:type I restriction enzyme S subunit